MRWFLLFCALAAAPAEAAVLRDGHQAVREALPNLGLEIVSERHTVPLPDAQGLCRRGHDDLNIDGSLSVLAGRPTCGARTTRVSSQRLEFGRRRGALLNEPFGFGGGGGMGAPILPLGRNERRSDTEAEGEGEEVASAAASLTLPPLSLTALAMPALRSQLASAPTAAPAPTPVPSAAWLFASGATALILRRRGGAERRARSQGAAGWHR